MALETEVLLEIRPKRREDGIARCYSERPYLQLSSLKEKHGTPLSTYLSLLARE